MFQNLTNNLSKIFDKLRNRGHISEAHLDETLREIRIALLEADVALSVIKHLIEQIRTKAIGQEVVKSISPGQMIIKIINDELISLLSSSSEDQELNLKQQPPVSIVFAGLQGSGKTTSAAKLSLNLKNKGKNTLLVSLDIYRPAAKEQLEQLAKSINIDSLPIINNEKIDDIILRAQAAAKKGGYDVVIYDTAGRLHIDEGLIEELKNVKKIVNPLETILVVDSLIGQDAANVAAKFNEAVSITGIILTRIDGDSRGGAALSVKFITGAPIKFVGTGEKITPLEPFIPERIASRILGMGDVVSLVEKAMSLSDQSDMEKTAKRMASGKFDLNDYAKQINNINKLGGISSIASMLPGFNKLQQLVPSDKMSNKPLAIQLAIIGSMTNKERKNPDLLNASRKKRIASGSGTNVMEVNRLLKQFMQIASLIKKTKNMDPKSLMRNLPKMF